MLTMQTQLDALSGLINQLCYKISSNLWVKGDYEFIVLRAKPDKLYGRLGERKRKKIFH